MNSIDIEFLAAACLDPQQIFANYTSKYLENYGTTVQKVLKDVIAKYEINTDMNTPNQGPHNLENIEMVSVICLNKMNINNCSYNLNFNSSHQKNDVVMNFSLS